MSNQAAKNNNETESIVRGSIIRVTFRNKENGFSVIQLQTEDAHEQLTVVGSSPAELPEGTEVVVRGNYGTHPKYGKQIQASSITAITPSSPDSIERYLSSGLFKGIGPKTAQRIVEEFGEKTLEVIYQYPEKLARITGISRSKAEQIHGALSDQQELREVMRFLVEHNISTGLASRIYKKYGDKAIEVLKRDPYILARQMKGVGFATADTIALNLGLAPDSPERLKAGVYHALEKARDDGHCYLPYESLINKAGVLLGLSEAHDLSSAIHELIEDQYIVKVDESLFLTPLYQAEQFVADYISERIEPHSTPEITESEVSNSINNAEKSLGINLSSEQRAAVLAATQYPLMILTGGPGCGKTTVIRAIVATFRDAKKRIALAAPTGRAAQRMAQVCSMPAKTIHRLLRFDPMTGGFLHNASSPLEEDGEPYDVVIIDESSMIDIQLAQDLFAAIPKDAAVILVGDKDQLPSVGPGRLFADLIHVPEVKTVTLSRLFRRESESTINDIAHSINAGIVPDIPQPDGATKVDAYFLPKRNPEEAAQLIESLVAKQIPEKFNIPREEITVLTPSNRGPLGVLALNERLQNVLNPIGDRASVTVQSQEFRIGDRICQRVNNYNIDAHGVFNGDAGIIESIDTKEKILRIELWDGRIIDYQEKFLSQLSLGYAMTIHRSQGSEISCVIVALHESQFTLLERQLIYTGITRAKKLLIVVGSKRALDIACKRTTAMKRCTLLHQEIEKRLR